MKAKYLLIISYLLLMAISVGKSQNSQGSLEFRIIGSNKKSGLKKVEISVQNNSDTSIFIEKWHIIQHSPVDTFTCGCYMLSIWCYSYWSFILMKNDSAVSCSFNPDLEDIESQYATGKPVTNEKRRFLKNPVEIVEVLPHSKIKYMARIFIHPEVPLNPDEFYTLYICYCGVKRSSNQKTTRLKLVGRIDY